MAWKMPQKDADAVSLQHLPIEVLYCIVEYIVDVPDIREAIPFAKTCFGARSAVNQFARSVLRRRFNVQAELTSYIVALVYTTSMRGRVITPYWLYRTKSSEAALVLIPVSTKLPTPKRINNKTKQREHSEPKRYTCKVSITPPHGKERCYSLVDIPHANPCSTKSFYANSHRNIRWKSCTMSLTMKGILNQVKMAVRVFANDSLVASHDGHFDFVQSRGDLADEFAYPKDKPFSVPLKAMCGNKHIHPGEFVFKMHLADRFAWRGCKRGSFHENFEIVNDAEVKTVRHRLSGDVLKCVVSERTRRSKVDSRRAFFQEGKILRVVFRELN